MTAETHPKPPRHGEGDRAKRGGGVFDTTRPVIETARRDRRSGNPAEVALWRALQPRPGGFKFRRQHPIGPYRLDFACLSQRLAIEIDGAAHDSPARIDRDLRRDADLACRGFRTLRIPARHVFADLDEVVRMILDACSLPPLHQPPAGPPPRSGEVSKVHP